MVRPTKADAALIAAVALTAAVFFLWGSGAIAKATDAWSSAVVEVVVDGDVVGSYPLQDMGSHRIDTPYGYNVIEIAEGAARVVEADCAGGDCVRMGAVRGDGQVIVCLPHHLAVTVRAAQTADVDVMVR